jgi:hypothetical protein
LARFDVCIVDKIGSGERDERHTHCVNFVTPEKQSRQCESLGKGEIKLAGV